MDKKELDFSKAIIDLMEGKVVEAIKVRTQLESVLRILRRKTFAMGCLEKKECDELGIDQTGFISAVLSYYKAYLETKKPPK